MATYYDIQFYIYSKHYAPTICNSGYPRPENSR